MRVGRYFAAVIAAMLFCAPAVRAQTSDTEDVSQQTTSSEQAQQAAGQALDVLELDSGPPVTYADVLRDPDNIKLNLRFARAQVTAGNVRGAAATLERILLVDPNLAQIRLFYAVVLFRLENLDEAEKEFRAVAAQDIPGDVRAEVERYLERIALSRRLTRYTATLSLGAHYDTNRNFAPVGGQRLVVDIPFVVDVKQPDIGYIGVGSIRVDHDLGYQDKHELFASLTYYHDEQEFQDTQDLQSFVATGGGVYRNAYMSIDVIPSLSYNHIRLSRETFFQELGGELRFERSFDPVIEGFASFRLSTQTFSPIRENTASQQRDGRQYSGTVGGSIVLTPIHLLSGDVTFLDKNAKGNFGTEFFSFRRAQLRLSHTWLLGSGQFLLNSLTFQRDHYQDPDAAVSIVTRRDEIWRYRMTYGAPLSFIFGKGTLWEAVEDVTFTPSVDILRQGSNLINFEVSNIKFQALLTKTWNF